MDNCDRLFEGSTSIDTAFLSALRLILRSNNTRLHLVLTLKRKDNADKIEGVAPKLAKTELSVNLGKPETTSYLGKRAISVSVIEEMLFEKLRSRNCATPLLVALVCDVWSQRENWETAFFRELDVQVPVQGQISEESGEIGEKRRVIAIGFLVKSRLSSLPDPAKRLIISLSVLSFDKTGNQVAFFSEQAILKLGSRVFPGAAESLADAFFKLDSRICDLRNDENEYAFRHETFQQATYDFFVGGDGGEFKNSLSLLHTEAARAFEELVIDAEPTERIKLAVSAAYHWIKVGDSAPRADFKTQAFQTAENIIDAVDSSMRMQFAYSDYQKVRLYLNEKLGPQSANTESRLEVLLENVADLGEIYYQGLDDWDESERMARAAKGSQELPTSGAIAQSQLQARHLWQILIYEKQIPEKIKPDAMAKLLLVHDIDKSIKANAYSTDGMYRIRAEQYDKAINSYENAITLAKQHSRAMIDTIDAKSLNDATTRFLKERLALWAELDIARYHSNKASAAAFIETPVLAAENLKAALDQLKAEKGGNSPLQPESMIPSRQEFQYVTLNQVCLYLAAGKVDAAKDAFDDCGKLPSEEWLNKTITMLAGIIQTYNDVFDDADRCLEKAERFFASLDPRNAAFARFNRIAARINCLVSEQYNGNKEREANEILLELSNVRARPFWASVQSFEDVSKFVQELRSPSVQPDLSSFIKQELLAICDEAKDEINPNDSSEETTKLKEKLERLKQILSTGFPTSDTAVAASDLSWGLNKLFEKNREELFGKEPVHFAYFVRVSPKIFGVGR